LKGAPGVNLYRDAFNFPHLGYSGNKSLLSVSRQSVNARFGVAGPRLEQHDQQYSGQNEPGVRQEIEVETLAQEDIGQEGNENRLQIKTHPGFGNAERIDVLRLRR
jgi:hypothetical protein